MRTTTETRAAADKPVTTPSAVSKFALKAMNGQIDRVSAILTGAADSIDEILGGGSSPLPESARGIVSSTSGKLRDLADRANADEAAKLIEGLQRTAANHPAATAGVGAALGAALGLALARLGAGATPARKTTKPARD